MKKVNLVMVMMVMMVSVVFADSGLNENALKWQKHLPMAFEAVSVRASNNVSIINDQIDAQSVVLDHMKLVPTYLEIVNENADDVEEMLAMNIVLTSAMQEIQKSGVQSFLPLDILFSLPADWVFIASEIKGEL